VEWFQERSSLYALLRRTRFTLTGPSMSTGKPQTVKWRDALDYAARHPGCCQIFDDGRFRTVMAGRYRLAALDIGDPRIQEGLKITERALEQMDISARSKGINSWYCCCPRRRCLPRPLGQATCRAESCYRLMKKWFWSGWFCPQGQADRVP